MSTKVIKKTPLMYVIQIVEAIGNIIPNPFWLFMALWGLILVASAVFSGASATEPVLNKTVQVKSLLTSDGIAWVIKNVPRNYMEFKALGLVIIMMIGLGVANGSGFLENAIKKLVHIPDRYLIFSVFIIGILGNIASSAASIIIPPLVAMLFYNKKKNPIFGLAVGFCAVSSGFSANLLITGTDVLYSGISTNIYKIVNPAGEVSVTSNYYFLAASVVIVSCVATFVTNKFLMPLLGNWEEKFDNCEMAEQIAQLEEAKVEDKKVNKGLMMVLYATILFWFIVFLIIFTGLLSSNAILNGIVFIMFLYFIYIGVVYGAVVGTVKRPEDVIKLMKKGISGCVTLMLIVLPIANFIEAFKHSNLATVLAVKLADFMAANHFTGLPMIIGIILIACFINMFMTSGSEKWALVAPVFIPALYYLNINPAATQLLFRIGDSATNTITPMYSYIALHLLVMQKYDKDAGLGTLISKTFPISMTFLLTWIIMIIVWYYFNWPIGPGTHFYLG